MAVRNFSAVEMQLSSAVMVVFLPQGPSNGADQSMLHNDTSGTGEHPIRALKRALDPKVNTHVNVPLSACCNAYSWCCLAAWNWTAAARMCSGGKTSAHLDKPSRTALN